jgi:hypothetical protein
MVRWGSDASADEGGGEVVKVSGWEVAVKVAVRLEMVVFASAMSEGVELGGWFIDGGS